jgi:hypothetical protein
MEQEGAEHTEKRHEECDSGHCNTVFLRDL